MTVAETTDTLTRRARRLALLTVGWNCVEGVVAVASGNAAGSVALLGFGLDSLIEVAAAGVVLWRLARDETAERRAALLIGLTYIGLALYITIDAVRILAGREHPDATVLGFAVSFAALVVMPGLALATVLGLLFNRAFGWWWADPIAALTMLPVIGKEGWHILPRATFAERTGARQVEESTGPA